MHLIVGHTHAYDPAIRLMHLLIASGALGKLGMINCFNYTNFLYRPRRPEELDTALGGGILFNQVPHQIDIARLLGGGLVKSVRAQTTVLDPARPTEGSCIAFLQFEDGAAASWSTADTIISIPTNGITGSTSAARRKRPRTAPPAARWRKERKKRACALENYAYGANRPGLPPNHQPHFGLMIATCASGEMRAS